MYITYFFLKNKKNQECVLYAQPDVWSDFEK